MFRCCPQVVVVALTIFWLVFLGGKTKVFLTFIGTEDMYSVVAVRKAIHRTVREDFQFQPPEGMWKAYVSKLHRVGLLTHYCHYQSWAFRYFFIFLIIINEFLHFLKS